MVEVLDELVFGSREAAWPLISHDLGPSYTEVALLFAIPSLVSLAVEPMLGILADRGRRRDLILVGGALFAVTTLAVGVAPGFAFLLVVTAVSYPASGAFVGLSQGVLMDDPQHDRVRMMAGWTLAGSLGVVIAPLAVAASLAFGVGWRVTFVLLGLVVAASLLAVRRLPPSTGDDSSEDLGSALRGV